MELKQQILEAMKAAMKDRDQVRVAALRLVRDAIQKAEINERLTLDDAGVQMVLAKLQKQRLESIEAFKAGNRPDLWQGEEKELEIIRGFMPRALNPEELAALVQSHLEATGAASAADMGKVMKSLKGHYEGRVSGQDLSAEVKRQLAAKTVPVVD